MALILGLPDQAFDDNGVVMPAAELYMFDDASPATPKTTYTTAALSVEHAHPVVADASGFFPQMFAANGAAFYAVLTATGGDPGQPFRDWEDIQALGADDTTSFDQTFTDARLKVTSGEVDTGIDGILFQVGKDSPQNTGGYAKFQGWAGTQADQFWFDAADAEFTGDVAVLGALSVTGAMPSDKYLDSGNETTAASVIIDIPTGYDAYDLEITNLITSASTSIEVFFGFDGATFKTGADDYAWSYTGLAPTATSSSDISDARLAIGTTGAAVTAGNPSRILITIDSIAGKETGISGSFRLANSDGAYATSLLSFVGQTRGKNYGKISQIKLAGNTANIGFRWVLKGKKGVV